MVADRFKNVRRPGVLVIPVLCLLAISASVNAQSDPAKAAMQDQSRREIQLNNLGRTTAPPTDRKRALAIAEQVGEDFQRILTLHNEIVRTLTTNGRLESQYVSDATGEIKKRSMRLQSSLRLAKPETNSKPETQRDQPTELRERLALLCRSIEDFVRNPIIENPGTVDAVQLQKARTDLQAIVELSDAIKKDADKQKP